MEVQKSVTFIGFSLSTYQQMIRRLGVSSSEEQISGWIVRDSLIQRPMHSDGQSSLVPQFGNMNFIFRVKQKADIELYCCVFLFLFQHNFSLNF